MEAGDFKDECFICATVPHFDCVCFIGFCCPNFFANFLALLLGFEAVPADFGLVGAFSLFDIEEKK